jgi:hypothetical protein
MSWIRIGGAVVRWILITLVVVVLLWILAYYFVLPGGNSETTHRLKATIFAVIVGGVTVILQGVGLWHSKRSVRSGNNGIDTNSGDP